MYGLNYKRLIPYIFTSDSNFLYIFILLLPENVKNIFRKTNEQKLQSWTAN